MIAAALALALAASAVTAADVADTATARPGSTAAQDPSAAALVIDGEDVAWPEFARWVLEVTGPEHAQEFVREAVLRSRARALGVLPTDAEIMAEVDADIAQRVALAFGGDAARHDAELEAIGSSPAEDRRRRARLVGARLVRDALARATRGVPDEAALGALHERRYGPDARELEVRVIRLRPPTLKPAPDETPGARERRARVARAELLERLAAVADRVRAGEDPAALARELSEDPESAGRGGALPAPFRRSAWPPPVTSALAGVAVGAPSAPVFARGFHNLFILTAARPVPLDEVRQDLERELRTREPDEAEREAAARRALDAAAPALEFFPLPAGSPGEDGAPPLALDAAIARLDGEAWSRGALARWIVESRETDLARRFVQGRRLLRRAEAAGAVPDPRSVDERAALELARTLEQVFGGDPGRMQRDLDRRGTSVARLLTRFRREAWRELAADGVLRSGREVTDEAVRAEWERRHGPLGLSLDARLIVRRLDGGRDRGGERLRLEELARDARAGADFGALAARWSDDPVARANGGRPAPAGTRFRHEDAPAAVQEALVRLEPGEVAGPLDLGARLALVLLVDRRRTRLGEVADELRAELVARPSTPGERAAFLVALERAPGWRVAGLPR